MKRLRMSIRIEAPREVVWQKMLAQESYRDWTSAFGVGSRYEGSWERGARIRFLSSSGEGMVSEIAESRPGEFVSIRHLGLVKDGVEDMTSAAARAWASAYENYTLTEKDGVTEVVVHLDTDEKFEAMFSDLWPKALGRLKEICEERPL
jgi:hypothetical protein